jgi:hypothetical protein
VCTYVCTYVCVSVCVCVCVSVCVCAGCICLSCVYVYTSGVNEAGPATVVSLNSLVTEMQMYYLYSDSQSFAVFTFFTSATIDECLCQPITDANERSEMMLRNTHVWSSHIRSTTSQRKKNLCL